MRILHFLCCIFTVVAACPALSQSFTSYETRGLSTRSDGDNDGDGLTDERELALGLNPALADTDGDALLDGWEVQGVNGLDLAAMGADPRRKDIFVEMDFMVRTDASFGLAPSDAVLDAIRAAFAAAPAENPDGSTGISIHLDLNEELPLDEVLDPAGPEFLALKAAHFKPERLPVFHYMIWADTYVTFTATGPTTGSSGNAFAIPNSDFIVTLGAWNGGQGGTDAQKIGTFIHELGHDLGLRHGGSDDEGYKPNHLSVMNYRWQTDGVIANGVRSFDYQRFQVGALDETALDEAAGLTSPDPDIATFVTAWIAPSGGVVGGQANGAIDWNQSTAIDDSVVTVDINGNGLTSTLTSTPNEWLGLIYNGGAIGQTMDLGGLALMQASRSREVLIPELTEQDAIANQVALP